MSASVTQTLTIMSSPPLASQAAPRPSAFSPPMSPSSVPSASSSPSTSVRSISTLHSPPSFPVPKSLKRQRPEPLSQPLTSAAALQSTGALPASFTASASSIFALSDLHSPTRPASIKRSKPSAVSLASSSSNSSSHSEHSPVSPFSTSSPVSPSSTSSATGYSSFLPQPPATATTSAATSPTSPTAASLPPLLTLSIPNRTSWFSLQSVDSIEKRALPEFFVKRNPPPTVTQANTRTPLPLVHQRPLSPTLPPPATTIVPPPSLSTGTGVASYMRFRNTLLLASALRPDVYLTGTDSRKLLGGVNAASVLRIHAFLESWGLINQHTQSQQGRKDAMAGSAEEAAVSFGLSDDAGGMLSSGGGKARRRANARRDAVMLDSMEGFVDKTFEVLDEESGVMHDMSLPLAMGIAV